jgi:hypothetical protein
MHYHLSLFRPTKPLKRLSTLEGHRADTGRALLHGVSCDDVADRLIFVQHITQIEVRRLKLSRELTVLPLVQDMPGSPVEQSAAARAVPPRTRSSRDLASRKLRSGTTIPDSGDALHTLVAAPATSGPRRDREDSACCLHLFSLTFAISCHCWSMVQLAFTSLADLMYACCTCMHARHRTVSVRGAHKGPEVVPAINCIHLLSLTHHFWFCAQAKRPMSRQ